MLCRAVPCCVAPRSFTLEASFAGASAGRYAGQHFSAFHLEQMGAGLLSALLDYWDKDQYGEETVGRIGFAGPEARRGWTCAAPCAARRSTATCRAPALARPCAHGAGFNELRSELEFLHPEGSERARKCIRVRASLPLALIGARASCRSCASPCARCDDAPRVGRRAPTGSSSRWRTTATTTGRPPTRTTRARTRRRSARPGPSAPGSERKVSARGGPGDARGGPGEVPPRC